MKNVKEIEATSAAYWRHIEPILRAHGFDDITCRHTQREYKSGFLDGYCGCHIPKPPGEALYYELAYTQGVIEAAEDNLGD